MSQHNPTKITKARHIKFLRSVFWLGLTAFGGPQMHLPQFKKRLVEKHRFFDHETLKEVNAFCSLLPGPSTTQTITVLGWKFGGPFLAFLSLLAWSLPGAIIMTIIALSPKFLGSNQLGLIQPMVAAFMIYAAISMFPWIRKSTLNYALAIGVGILGSIINTPILFPLGLILAGFFSAQFNKYELPAITAFTPEKIAWKNLTAFALIFLLVGGVGMLLSQNEQYLNLAKPIILFENTYRIGALSFGGGNTMAAMSFEQYVLYQNRLTPQEFSSGLGLLQALPGPNFNFMVYVNAISMKSFDFNVWGQFAGCLIGLIAIFLPGTLMVFFAYPVYTKVQNIRQVRLSLDGIFAAAVGFIMTAALTINKNYWMLIDSRSKNFYLEIAIFFATLILLMSRKIPTPFIVLFVILIGWLFS